jgi:hypothetical protein
LELKEFIEETLVQIVSGVKAAQKKCADTGAIISPRLANKNGVTQIADKSYSFQLIEFEAVLGELKENEEGSSIGVMLANLGLGAKMKSEERSTSQTKVKFTVPVILPSIDNKETEPKKKVATPVI